MRIMNSRQAIGLIMSSSKAEGTAPINGPKKGMILVTPTTTEIIIAIGMFSIVIAMKQMMPIMIESIILPLINPPKVLFDSLPSSKIASACSLENNALMRRKAGYV